MKNIIQRAADMLSKAEDKCKLATMMYEVFVGTDRDRLTPHGSMDTYCEKCIDDAVEDKKREYFLDRLKEMGKIYEYQERGYYLLPIYSGSKDGNNSRLILKKIKHKHPQQKVIAQLKRDLRKKYPSSMIFSFEQWDTTTMEHDGFELCDGCGIMFQQGLIVTDQELDHWEEKKSLKGFHKDPDSAYCLSKIFYEYTGAGKYDNRILSLATKLVNDNKLAKP